LGIIVLGLVGSFKKSTKFLAAYFALLFVFIICEFGVGGGAYALQSKIPTTLENSWATLPVVDRNALQSTWNCCGWLNPQDFPGSNCNHTMPTYNASATTTGIVYATTGLYVVSAVGCQNEITSYFQSQLYSVGTVGIVFATLQLLALISSIVVFAFIKVEQRRSQDERF